MAKRITKQKTYITLPEEAIKKIEAMVSSWSYDTKAFVRSRLNQYRPSHPVISGIKTLGHLVFSCAGRKSR